MNLKRLQTFIHVVDHRGFSEAAEIMQMTQSGVSRQIKALEEEVGIQLLQRKAFDVELTMAGRLVYQKATSLLAQWEQLLQECQELTQELNGILKIGASTIPGTHLLPRIIKTFQSKNPKVEFSIRIADSSDISTALEKKQVDIAIVGRKLELPHLQTQSIAADRLVLIGKGFESKIQSLAELNKFSFIAREKGSGTREATDRSLRQHGIEPENLHYTAEVSSTESILAMVEAGVGVAFVSYWAVQELMRENVSVLYELPTDRCFYLAFHEARAQHPLIHAFVQETLRVYSGNQPGGC